MSWWRHPEVEFWGGGDRSPLPQDLGSFQRHRGRGVVWDYAGRIVPTQQHKLADLGLFSTPGMESLGL
jgi:hypothetical protein